MAPICVVKKQPWPRDRPIGQNLHQPPLGEMLVDVLAVNRIGNAQALQCRFDADV